MTVPRVELAPGLSVPRLITGMWQIADMERSGRVDPVATAAAMEPYARAGLDAFDMADHYGSAEVVAGGFGATEAGADARFLTKWVPDPAAARGADGDVRAAVSEAVDRAAGRLRRDRLDLLQYHAWRYSDPVWLDHLLALDALRREGRIGALGLTNFDTDHLRTVVRSGIPVATNQVCFSLLDRRPLDAMTAFCAEEGVSILAFGTLAGGLLTERWKGVPAPDPDDLDTWSQMKYRRFVEVAGGWDRFQALLDVVHEVALKRGVSMANVATRWVLDQPGVAAAIVGARLGRSGHVEDNLGVFGFGLDASDRAALEAAAAELDPVPGHPGDEYRKPPFLTASGDLSHHVDTFPPPYRVVTDGAGSARVDSGTSWEGFAGYSRAVRTRRRIHVSGTTATHGHRLVGGTDAAAQTVYCLDKIQGAVESLGGRLEDVVRTRIFVSDVGHWEAVARVHGRRFAHVRPANTLVRADLIGEEYLVEIEAEAWVDGTGGREPPEA